MIDLYFVFYLLERVTETFCNQSQKFILESQTELLEVEMGKCLYCIGPWIVHDLRDQCVDVRIPFQVPAKGVKACDHPELQLMAEAAV